MISERVAKRRQSATSAGLSWEQPQESFSRSLTKTLVLSTYFGSFQEEEACIVGSQTKKRVLCLMSRELPWLSTSTLTLAMRWQASVLFQLPCTHLSKDLMIFFTQHSLKRSSLGTSKFWLLRRTSKSFWHSLVMRRQGTKWNIRWGRWQHQRRDGQYSSSRSRCKLMRQTRPNLTCL